MTGADGKLISEWVRDVLLRTAREGITNRPFNERNSGALLWPVAVNSIHFHSFRLFCGSLFRDDLHFKTDAGCDARPNSLIAPL
jgi:hypothetical protein